MVINARMPALKRRAKEDKHAAPIVLGIQLVPDNTHRVTAWTMPNGSAFYCRVFRSIDSRRSWQALVSCQGFNSESNGKTPQEAADVASERIRGIVRVLRGVVE